MVGYIEEDDDEEGEGEGGNKVEGDQEHKEAKEERSRPLSEKGPLLQVASRTVMLLPTSRLDINMVSYVVSCSEVVLNGPG